MSFNIAECFVDIGANLSPLKVGVAQAKGIVSGIGGQLGAALSGPLAALGIGAGIGAFAAMAVKSFAEAEAAEAGLAAALRSHGQDVESNMAKYKDFAAAIQRTTTVEGDSVLPLIKLGIQNGLGADAAQEYAKAAIGLGEAFGSPEAAMEALTKAANGNDMSLKRALPQLGDSANAAETLARAAQLGAQGMAEQQDKTNTTAGAWAKLKAEFGDVMESMGGVIAQGLLPLMNWFRNLLATINEFVSTSSSGFGTVAGAASDLLGGTVGSIFSWLGSAITAITFEILTFGYYGTQLGNAFVIGFGTLWDAGSWALGNLMNLLTWFANNWATIFQDVFNYAVTLFMNLGENIKRFFVGLWDFIKSGGRQGFEQGFVGLAEGFKAKTQQLPEYQRYMEGEFTKIGREQWQRAFDQHEEQRKKFYDTMDTQDQRREEEKKKMQTAANLQLTQTGENKDDKKKKGGEGSVFVSATEAWKQIQASVMKNDKDKAAEATAKNTEKIATGIDKLVEANKNTIKITE